MALNLEAVGKVWGPYDFTYTERDLMIYALGIGFTRENLEYVYEGSKDFKGLSHLRGRISQQRRGGGLFVHPGELCHGRSRGADPGDPRPAPAGRDDFHDRFDRRNLRQGLRRADRHASGIQKTRTATLLCTNWLGIFVRGAGGFWRPRSAQERRPAGPGEKPDLEFAAKTWADQAAFYRLTGDRNPLHIDRLSPKPWISKSPSSTGCAPTGSPAAGLCRRS